MSLPDSMSSLCSRISATSCPARNARPSPASTRQRTSRSASTAARCSSNSPQLSMVMALRRSGRLNFSHMTCPCFSRMNRSVMMILPGGGGGVPLRLVRARCGLILPSSAADSARGEAVGDATGHRIDVPVRPDLLLAGDPRRARWRSTRRASTWCRVRESRPSGGVKRQVIASVSQPSSKCAVACASFGPCAYISHWMTYW